MEHGAYVQGGLHGSCPAFGHHRYLTFVLLHMLWESENQMRLMKLCGGYKTQLLQPVAMNHLPQMCDCRLISALMSNYFSSDVEAWGWFETITSQVGQNELLRFSHSRVDWEWSPFRKQPGYTSGNWFSTTECPPHNIWVNIQAIINLIVQDETDIYMVHFPVVLPPCPQPVSLTEMSN